MENLFYKDYTITPGAVRDERTGDYAPTVHIVWYGADKKRGSRSFTLEERCPKFSEATAVAQEQAKVWADRWLAP